MLDFGFYNMDCMDGMKEFPDQYFDLAIVDPPYGGVTQGGYMSNQCSGGVAKNRNDYHLALWQQEKPTKEYFDELKRVSKAQIIWGGTITLHFWKIVNAGLYGIRKSRMELVMRTLNLLGRRLIARREFIILLGTE